MSGRAKLCAVQPIWGERLAAKLLKRGKQAEIAHLLGITSSAISLWKSGERIPGADWITELCRALETHPDWLLGFSDVESLAPPAPPKQVEWKCPCCGAKLVTTRAAT